MHCVCALQVSVSLDQLQAAEMRRQREAEAAAEELAQSKAQRERECNALTSSIAQERIERLRVTVRLTGLWHAAIYSGERDCDALIGRGDQSVSLFRSELKLMEEEYARLVSRTQNSSEASIELTVRTSV